MKNFELLLCFLLCVVPCVFTQKKVPDNTSIKEMEEFARTTGLTLQDIQECLNKANADLDTIFELSDLMLREKTPQTEGLFKKVGCFGACVYKKNGLMVNNKILPEKVLEYLSDQDISQEDIKFMRKSFIDCSNLASRQSDECDIIISFTHCGMQKMLNH